MKSTRSASLMAAVAMATLSTLAPTTSGFSGVATADAPSVNRVQADTGKQAPGDTKSARLNTGYVRRWRAPRGKRYSASIRQHQRHAAKARNRAKARR